MLTEPVVLTQTYHFSAIAAIELFAAIWQILAILAIGGIVLVVVLAIIEPGPLVKRRPFPRKHRPEQLAAEEENVAEPEVSQMPAGVDENAEQWRDGR